MEYREDVMGLVKHFHHQPNISRLSEITTIAKDRSSTAHPQKHFYSFVREERVQLQLCQLRFKK